MSWFRSEFSRWGTPVRRVVTPEYPSLPRLNERTRALFELHLKRGIPIARLREDEERMHYWMAPGEMLRHRYQFGQTLIGKLGDTFLGYDDDRPMVTVAGTRAGKTSTLLEPNIYLHRGSMLVHDPKGDLARTASFRRLIGHRAYVLDPFGQSGELSASFNALDELDPDDEAVIDDAMAVIYALVPETDGGGNAKHFNDSARTLLLGCILVALTLPKEERHLVTVRELLCLTYGPLAEAGRIRAASLLAEASKDEKKKYFKASAQTMTVLFNKMITLKHRLFGGIAAQIGNRLKETPVTERGSIFSTAAVHTDFIDSLLLRRTLKHSDFRLRDLRGDRPVTIYLCLPVGRMERHYRWLRLFVQLACLVLEGMGPYPRERTPILFMLEEFPTLAHMDIMERASAYFPGFGIKPWFIVQDIGQLRRHYQNWQSFLGNAGLLQFFANGDGETLDYISQRLGKLVAPWELDTAFARENMSQILLMKGRPPAAALRPEHGDVPRIRDAARVAFAQRQPLR